MWILWTHEGWCCFCSNCSTLCRSTVIHMITVRRRWDFRKNALFICPSSWKDLRCTALTFLEVNSIEEECVKRGRLQLHRWKVGRCNFNGQEVCMTWCWYMQYGSLVWDGTWFCNFWCYGVRNGFEMVYNMNIFQRCCQMNEAYMYNFFVYVL
jgi:hypothetical protein